MSFPPPLAGTALTLRAQGASLLAGVFVLGFFSFLGEIVAVRTRLEYRDHQISGYLLRRDSEELSRLEVLGRGGDAAARAEARTRRAELSRRLAVSALSERGTRIDALAEATLFSVVSALRACLLLVGFLYVLVLATAGGEPLAVVRRLPPLFFPSVAMFTCMIAASFLWIPLLYVALSRIAGPAFDGAVGAFNASVLLLGSLAFLLIAPRLALAPVLLARDGLGARASVRESFRRTSGHWHQLLWSLSIAGFSLLAVAWMAAQTLRPFFPPQSPVLQFVAAIVSQAAFAVFVTFLARASLAILAPVTSSSPDSPKVLAPLSGPQSAPSILSYSTGPN